MPQDDHELAAALARRAGDLLLTCREDELLTGRELGAAGDAVAQAYLARALAACRPDDRVLSEEAADDRARLDAERVWIVDPLDGTREYGEGREDWAVHVALATGGRPLAAAVAVPAQGRVLRTDPPQAVPPRAAGSWRIAVSRSRSPAVAEQVARALGAELVPLGSAGYKAAMVVGGQADAYVHAGGQHEWDSAAPVGVAIAAGLHASRLDGSALEYNRPDTRLPDLVICRPELAEPLLGLLAST